MIRSRRPLGLLLGVVLTMVALGGLVAAVRDDPPRQAGGTRAAALVEARDGVCQALEEARAGRVEAARRAFVNRAHQPLHDLAAAAGERDREVAARLLEAKQRVEGDFENGDDALVANLRELGAAADVALAAIGGGERGPCGTSQEDR